MMWIRAIGVSLLAAYGASSHPAVAPRVVLTLTLERPNVVGGNAVNATVALGVAAPAAGAIVTVTNPPGTTVQAGTIQSGVQQPGSTRLLVPAGQTSVVFRLVTRGVATNTVATLTATAGSDQAAAALVIAPARPKTVTITPRAVTGGQSVVATITLDGAAPDAGVDVSLTVVQPGFSAVDGSSRTIDAAALSGASISSLARFTPGASSVTASVATPAVAREQSVFIVAALGGTSASGSVTVKPPIVTAIQLSPAIVLARTTSTGTVVLNGPAPVGASVLLSSANASASVPSQVSVAVGATTATFPITTSAPSGGGTAMVAVVISARMATTATTTAPPPTSGVSDGTSNTIQLGESAPVVNATLTVLPPMLVQSASVSPSPVAGGSPIALSIVVSDGATGPRLTSGPTNVSAGTAQISVDQPSLVQLPASVNIPGQPGVVTVNGTTAVPAADATVLILTTFGGTTTTSRVLVKAPVLALASFVAQATRVTGGTKVIVLLKPSASVTQNTLVTLTTNRPDLIQLPGSVSVPAGGPLTLAFPTVAVKAETSVTITATAGTQKLDVKVDIVP